MYTYKPSLLHMIAFSTETTSARDSSAVTGCQYSAHVKSTKCVYATSNP